MRLRNLLVHIREIGVLIATPARHHFAVRSSKTKEIVMTKSKETPRNKAFRAPFGITAEYQEIVRNMATGAPGIALALGGFGSVEIQAR